jgi:hypothetical protein
MSYNVESGYKRIYSTFIFGLIIINVEYIKFPG